jgi:hypothetical protein
LGWLLPQQMLCPAAAAAAAVVFVAVQAPYKGVFQKIGEMFQTS